MTVLKSDIMLKQCMLGVMAIFSWLTSFNPDYLVKGFSVAASVAVILSARSTIRKNRKT